MHIYTEQNVYFHVNVKKLDLGLKRILEMFQIKDKLLILYSSAKNMTILLQITAVLLNPVTRSRKQSSFTPANDTTGVVNW